MVEQPMPEDLDNIARLTSEPSPFSRTSRCNVFRMWNAEGVFSGINIVDEVYRHARSMEMRNLARALGMKVMMGCMTETSCAISAAAQVYPGMDFADLDGALLIGNDCFEGAALENGKIIASDRPGIGVKPVKELSFGR